MPPSSPCEFPEDDPVEQEARRYFERTAAELTFAELVALTQFNGRLVAGFLALAGYHGAFAAPAGGDDEAAARHRRRADAYDAKADFAMDQLHRHFDRIRRDDPEHAALLEAQFDARRDLALFKASKRSGFRIRAEVLRACPRLAATPAGVN